VGGLNADWLSQLAADHAPPPPGWWPPAPGWWALALLCALAAAALVYWLRHPARRLRRAALRELAHLQAASGNDAELARDLEHLLRRYAVARCGRDTVARLSGPAWIDFVVAHGGAALAGEVGDDLLRAAYGGRAATHRTQWLTGARGFLRKARA
jgi:hypothetical protein